MATATGKETLSPIPTHTPSPVVAGDAPIFLPLGPCQDLALNARSLVGSLCRQGNPPTHPALVWLAGH